MNFKKKKQNHKVQKKKQEKKDVLKNLHNIFDSREKVLNAFDSNIFPIKTKGSLYLNKCFRDYQ